MGKLGLAILLLLHGLFVNGCAIQTEVQHQYKLDSFSQKKFGYPKSRHALLVTQPEAVAGYQTEGMQYVAKPYELSSFVHNAWVGTPANMLFPLMLQSMQGTGYFFAVSSSPYSDKADYRLDTQLIALQQSFLTTPSREELVIKVVLTHIEDNRVVASTIFHEYAACPQNTPYGGVIAANQTTQAFTSKLADFVVSAVKNDNSPAARKD